MNANNNNNNSNENHQICIYYSKSDKTIKLN